LRVRRWSSRHERRSAMPHPRVQFPQQRTPAEQIPSWSHGQSPVLPCTPTSARSPVGTWPPDLVSPISRGHATQRARMSRIDVLSIVPGRTAASVSRCRGHRERCGSTEPLGAQRDSCVGSLCTPRPERTLERSAAMAAMAICMPTNAWRRPGSRRHRDDRSLVRLRCRTGYGTRSAECCRRFPERFAIVR
jgi:hypothetical protein